MIKIRDVNKYPVYLQEMPVSGTACFWEYDSERGAGKSFVPGRERYFITHYFFLSDVQSLFRNCP